MKIVIAGVFLFFGLFPSVYAHQINDIEFVGLESTKRETLIDLLPAALPHDLSDEDIAEFSRRVKNLAVYDSVQVAREGTKLQVVLSHKTTLSPIVGFSTGKTLKDTSATLGLVEHNMFGRATRLGGKVSYVERGINFAAWIDEHTYSPNSWAHEVEVYKLSSGFRFKDTAHTWTRDRWGGFSEWVTPFRYGSKFIFEIQPSFYYEHFTRTSSSSPEEGFYFGSLVEVVYDASKWDDLFPAGYRASLEFRPGYFTRGDFRGETRLKFQAGHTVAESFAMVANFVTAAVNPGNANHSFLIGSQQGVRGLSDSLYRCAYLGYSNLELRYALKVYNRLYFQPVAFADAGTFRPMNAEGGLEPWTKALSTGVGARLIPTGLTNLLVRADLARLHLPVGAWYAQFGISQYF